MPKTKEYRGRPEEDDVVGSRSRIDRIVDRVQAPIDPSTGAADSKFKDVVRHNVERGIKIYGA